MIDSTLVRLESDMPTFIEDAEAGELFNATFSANNRYNDPERRLLFAVLDDAIKLYLSRKTDAKSVRRAEKARQWLYGEEPALIPFEMVCEEFNLSQAVFLRELEKRRPHR